MKQIVQHLRSGRLEILETPVPIIRAGCILVRTTRSAISPGTERQMLRWGQQSLLDKARSRPDLIRLVLSKVRRDGWLPALREAFARLDAPRPLGYSSAGIVEAVGEGVTGYRPGDRVACGGAGFANHAEQVCVPHNLVARIPDGVTDEEAAFAMLAAIALRGLQRCEVRSGDHVALIGLGVLGQLAVQLARASGARVLALDVDAGRVDIAQRIGAEATAVVGRDDPGVTVGAFAPGGGCDAVVITAASPTNEPLLLAAEMARRGGRVVVVGLTGMTIPREAYWEKELDLRLSRAAGPGSEEPVYGPRDDADLRWTAYRNLTTCLNLMAADRLRVEPLITHRFRIANAAEAYRLVTGETRQPSLGVVLAYDESADPPRRVVLSTAEGYAGSQSQTDEAPVTVGLIGAGLFARTTLLPILRTIPMVRVRAVASAGGASAVHAARLSHAAYVAADAAEILGDPQVSAVIVATRHDTHAALVAAALRAGKHVFVEKPLATTLEGLRDVAAAGTGSGRVFLVGFNRRYAPLVAFLKEGLPAAAQPFLITVRVNAGPVPPDHWVLDPIEGGGRLVSEACHFLDLMQFLGGALITEVAAVGLPDQSATITARLANGSIGTVHYVCGGDRVISRERIEVFGSGVAGTLEDFRTAMRARAGRVERRRAWSADRGYRAELVDWAAAISEGRPLQADVRAQIAASLATLKAVEALHRAAPMPVRVEEVLDGP